MAAAGKEEKCCLRLFAWSGYIVCERTSWDWGTGLDICLELNESSCFLNQDACSLRMPYDNSLLLSRLFSVKEVATSKHILDSTECKLNRPSKRTPDEAKIVAFAEGWAQDFQRLITRIAGYPQRLWNVRKSRTPHLSSLESFRGPERPWQQDWKWQRARQLAVSCASSIQSWEQNMKSFSPAHLISRPTVLQKSASQRLSRNHSTLGTFDLVYLSLTYCKISLYAPRPGGFSRLYQMALARHCLSGFEPKK